MFTKPSWKLYLWSTGIGLGCFYLAYQLPSSFIGGMLAVPGVVSLISTVFLIVRDHNEHLRNLDLQHRGHDFDLAVASHMAKIVFDKHADFCEKYMKRVTTGIRDFYGTGPSKTALSFAGDLAAIRQDHTTWLTKEIDERLAEVEQALREIGANEHLLDHLPPGENRTQVVGKTYEKFKSLLSIGKGPKDDQSREMAFADILDFFREILGVTQLTTLRKTVIEGALSRLDRERTAQEHELISRP